MIKKKIWVFSNAFQSRNRKEPTKLPPKNLNKKTLDVEL